MGTVAENGVDIILDEDCVTPEEIGLITETMPAASFTLVTDPLNFGVHNVVGVLQDAAELRRN